METPTPSQVSINTVNDVQKVIYTAKTHVTGGRDGYASSSDNRLQTKLGTPGISEEGTNPEQLFAAGWSACFIGAMQLSAPAMEIKIPQDTAVDAEVDLATAKGGFFIQARLNVSLPGLTLAQAKDLVNAAHNNCPYSKATRGNINLEINVTV